MRLRRWEVVAIQNSATGGPALGETWIGSHYTRRGAQRERDTYAFSTVQLTTTTVLRERGLPPMLTFVARRAR